MGSFEEFLGIVRKSIGYMTDAASSAGSVMARLSHLINLTVNQNSRVIPSNTVRYTQSTEYTNSAVITSAKLVARFAVPKTGVYRLKFNAQRGISTNSGTILDVVTTTRHANSDETRGIGSLDLTSALGSVKDITGISTIASYSVPSTTYTAGTFDIWLEEGTIASIYLYRLTSTSTPAAGFKDFTICYDELTIGNGVVSV